VRWRVTAVSVFKLPSTRKNKIQEKVERISTSY